MGGMTKGPSSYSLPSGSSHSLLTRTTPTAKMAGWAVSTPINRPHIHSGGVRARATQGHPVHPTYAATINHIRRRRGPEREKRLCQVWDRGRDESPLVVPPVNTCPHPFDNDAVDVIESGHDPTFPDLSALQRALPSRESLVGGDHRRGSTRNRATLPGAGAPGFVLQRG